VDPRTLRFALRLLSPLLVILGILLYQMWQSYRTASLLTAGGALLLGLAVILYRRHQIHRLEAMARACAEDPDDARSELDH